MSTIPGTPSSTLKLWQKVDLVSNVLAESHAPAEELGLGRVAKRVGTSGKLFDGESNLVVQFAVCEEDELELGLTPLSHLLAVDRGELRQGVLELRSDDRIASPHRRVLQLRVTEPRATYGVLAAVTLGDIDDFLSLTTSPAGRPSTPTTSRSPVRSSKPSARRAAQQ